MSFKNELACGTAEGGLVQARPSSHAHYRVYETAVEMGHQLYDHMMMDNQWYAQWRAANPELKGQALEARFVAKNLRLLLPQARAAMAALLRTTNDEVMKEEIYEALCLDATLVKGRVQ